MYVRNCSKIANSWLRQPPKIGQFGGLNFGAVWNFAIRLSHEFIFLANTLPCSLFLIKT